MLMRSLVKGATLLFLFQLNIAFYLMRDQRWTRPVKPLFFSELKKQVMAILKIGSVRGIQILSSSKDGIVLLRQSSTQRYVSGLDFN